MELVQAIQTRDGKLFTADQQAEAKAHEAELDFDAWYQENEASGNYAGSRVESHVMKDWLRTHRAKVLRFLGA